ncbi:hypothetical protein [Streptomyces bacillaris]|uniref:hypothetical protein n=1 Tax=Streptomyces bacillaris TaxID=68179 RepID=UPI003D9F5888
MLDVPAPVVAEALGYHRVTTATAKLASVLADHRRLRRRYEHKAERFLAFVGIASVLIGYRRLAK